MKKQKYGISTLVCPECENTFPIPRRIKRQRKRGHIKTMWCPFCKEMRNFVERGIEK